MKKVRENLNYCKCYIYVIIGVYGIDNYMSSYNVYLFNKKFVIFRFNY